METIAKNNMPYHLLIIKTNLETKKKINSILPIFNNHQFINDWSVDIEDVDNVLRIESLKTFKEADLLALLQNHGFEGELLPD